MTSGPTRYYSTRTPLNAVAFTFGTEMGYKPQDSASVCTQGNASARASLDSRARSGNGRSRRAVRLPSAVHGLGPGWVRHAAAEGPAETPRRGVKLFRPGDATVRTWTAARATRRCFSPSPTATWAPSARCTNATPAGSPSGSPGGATTATSWRTRSRTPSCCCRWNTATSARRWPGCRRRCALSSRPSCWTAGGWPAVAGLTGVAVVVGGCGAAFPPAAIVLLPVCFVLLAAAAAFTLDEPASLVVDVTPTGPVRRTQIRAVALLAPLAAGALVLLAAALRGQALPWAAAGLALAGNVLLGFGVVDRPRGVRGGHRHLDRRPKPAPVDDPVILEQRGAAGNICPAVTVARHASF